MSPASPPALVLDSGALSALAGQRATLQELRRRNMWPAVLPTVVLAESLTGDHRRDFHVNRLLRTCSLQEIDETVARAAARLRTATGRAGSISVVDALVIALADTLPAATVLTSDPDDLGALAQHTSAPVRVVSI